MKHVWILNHYAQEPGQIGLTRHYYLARHLLPLGWKASIVAASTEHNTGRQRLAAGEATRLETHDGVPFLWLRAPVYRGNGADRVWNMLVYTWRALSKSSLSSLEPPDVIVGSSVHPLAALAASRLARRFDVPFIFEVRDLWPQTLIDTGLLSSNGIPARLLRRLELFLYREAEYTISPLPLAKDYIVPLGIPESRVVHISNGFDHRSFQAYPYVRRPNGTFELMYFGAHGEANGLDTLIRAMHLVEKMTPERRVRLRMIGSGPRKAELEQLARDLGVTTIDFEAPVPKVDIPRLASEADAFVLCVRDLPNLYRYGISMNKLFDYLAAARPIILASAASNNPIADSGAGITVPPENPQKLAEGIVRMSAMPAVELIRLGEAGREHALRNYTFEALARKLGDLLDNCCEGRL